MGKRGAYFFVIDAFIASIIIVMGIVIILGNQGYKPHSTQTFYTAEDFLSTTETTEIRNIDDARIRQMMTAGVIDDPKSSVMTQMAKLSLRNDMENLTYIAQAMVNNTPQTVNIMFSLNSTAGTQKIYSRNSTPAESAALLLTAKRVIILRKSQTEMYPPIIMEAKTWQ